jgi:hypothetical protein
LPVRFEAGENDGSPTNADRRHFLHDRVQQLAGHSSGPMLVVAAPSVEGIDDSSTFGAVSANRSKTLRTQSSALHPSFVAVPDRSLRRMEDILDAVFPVKPGGGRYDDRPGTVGGTMRSSAMVFAAPDRAVANNPPVGG